MPASRAPAAEPERYRIHDLVVDVEAAEVTRRGEALTLPPRTFELLVALARRFPHVALRHELLETVWQGESVTDQTLSHRVMVLRRALDDDAVEPHYVAGARGWGYRLVGPVERTGGGARRATDEPRPRRRGWGVVTVALAVGLVAILVIARFVVGRAPPSPVPRTVAVQPLATRGLAPGLETVATDLTAAIAARLRRAGPLRVVPGDGPGPRPDLWIEGSLSGSVEQIDLRLRLVEGSSRRALWTRNVRGHLYEVLAGEEGTVAAVALVVQRRLGTPTTPSPVSARVREQSLRAQVLWLSWTSDGNRRAAALWSAALDAEPRHAPAHAGVALAASVAALLGYRSPAETEAEARSHARLALQLDERSGMAHAADALVRLLFDHDIAAAAAVTRRADVDDPEELTAVMADALVLEAEGRFDDGLARLRDAAEPEWAGLLLLEGRAQQGKARWNEALAAYERALALEPDLPGARLGRAECLTAAGHAPEALLALRGLPPKVADDLRPPVGTAPELARAWRRRCQMASLTPRERARACLLGGDSEAALAALRAGLTGHWPFVVFVPKDPAFAALVGRPDFPAAFSAVKPGSP